jgi:hypothetical protein
MMSLAAPTIRVMENFIMVEKSFPGAAEDLIRVERSFPGAAEDIIRVERSFLGAAEDLIIFPEIAEGLIWVANERM